MPGLLSGLDECCMYLCWRNVVAGLRLKTRVPDIEIVGDSPVSPDTVIQLDSERTYTIY